MSYILSIYVPLEFFSYLELFSFLSTLPKEIKNPKTSNNKLLARRQKKKLAKLEDNNQPVQNVPVVSQNNVRDMVTD